MTVRPLILLFLAPLAAMAQTASPLADYDEAASRALDRALDNAGGPLHYASAAVVSPEVTVAAEPGPVRSGDSVNAYANRFWKGQAEDLRVALARLTRIRPVLEQILAEEGVPPEFSAVVLVESGANPVALSPKSARGLWQFVPETAARYGLVVEEGQDDRIDLFKSTHAAARYLRDLYQTFGEWQLALAAYDAGEGAVREAIRRAHSWNFRILSDRRMIPAETRNYVPAVLGAVNLLQFQ